MGFGGLITEFYALLMVVRVKDFYTHGIHLVKYKIILHVEDTPKFCV